MELLSFLIGVDNLRKLMVMLGLGLFVFGLIYPIQKTLELKESQIKYIELKNIDSINISNLTSDVNNLSEIIKLNDSKLKSLSKSKDSLLKLNFTDPVKFNLESIIKEINLIKEKDEQSVKGAKQRLTEIQSAEVKTQTLQKTIDNLTDFINSYHTARWIMMLAGIGFFIIGIWGWIKSQKESDKLKGIEIDIKQEELKKLRRENGRGTGNP